MSQHEPIVPVPDNKATQHDGARHLAINNSWRYRVFTLLALQSTARFYRCNGPCVPISKHLMVKIGPFVHLTEAATLKIVADKTSIPVPHVYCSLAHKNQAFILMERIRGQTLAEVWDGLSDTERESVLTQLKRMTGDLRAIPSPPGTGIESCVGGSLRDSRIPRCRPRMGPFKTVQVFHFWLRDYLRLEEHGTRQGDGDWQDVKEMVAKQDEPWPAPVFTHEDLNPLNILLYGNRVVGLVDWEFAGWYPCYWEYTSAWCGNITLQAWQDEIAKFLDPYPRGAENGGHTPEVLGRCLLSNEACRAPGAYPQPWVPQENPSGIYRYP